jgi:hypothetical protein
VVAADHNLELCISTFQHLDHLLVFGELPSEGEIASMDKDISFGEGVAVRAMFKVCGKWGCRVGVRDDADTSFNRILGNRSHLRQLMFKHEDGELDKGKYFKEYVLFIGNELSWASLIPRLRSRQ